MSTGVSDHHQRNKGQGNSGNQPYANLTKDHHVGEHEEVDSWRNQQQQGHHQQGYASSMASDPYMSSYYGSFQYPTFGVNEGGPWSTNGGDMPFVGGAAYSGMPESGAGGHYNDGMFSGGNGGGGGFGNFGGGQPGFGYGGGGGGGFHGNGDYNAWGPQPRKHYDEYYRDGMYDDRGMKMIEQGMGGLGLGASEKELKDFKEMMSMQQQGGGGQKKTTWASIASQPAKPQSISKKSKQPGMPPPPMIPGAWENKNGVSKTPIAAPVQVPAWERPKIPPPVQPPPQQPPPPQSMPLGNQNIPPSRGYQQQQQPPMSFMPPQTHQPPPPMIQNSRSQNSLPPLQVNHSNGNHAPPAPSSPPGPKYPDELKMKLDYNPATFDLLAEGCRFFVIKSYSEDDIHRSIKYEIWCSTEHGNKRLDEAYREREGKGPIYLLFSVNGSGHFCGMAQMISAVDYHASSSVWSQDKWKGQFKVKWIYVKDVPNAALRHIRLENNENKPVTNSRDTQEVPLDKGKQVLKILHTYHHTTSIFDDFIHYEKRQEEEDQRKVEPPAPAPPVHNNMRNDRGGGGGGGRGGFHDRGGGGFHGNHHGMAPNHHPRDRDFGRDNPREFREHRGGGRDGYMPQRNDHRMDNRDQYNPREERGDRGDPREPRDREHRGGGGGMSRGRPAPMRN